MPLLLGMNFRCHGPRARTGEEARTARSGYPNARGRITDGVPPTLGISAESSLLTKSTGSCWKVLSPTAACRGGRGWDISGSQRSAGRTLPLCFLFQAGKLRLRDVTCPRLRVRLWWQQDLNLWSLTLQPCHFQHTPPMSCSSRCQMGVNINKDGGRTDPQGGPESARLCAPSPPSP